MLPNFLIIGAMKSGTTTLYHYLKAHPDIYMTDNKEPQYFSDEEVYSKGLKWYESLFKGHNSESAIGEASTNYAKYPTFKNVPERIHALIPDVKLIYILRDPVERIYSHFVHNYYMGRIDNDVSTAVRSNDHYISVSKYFYQIEQFLKYFDRNNIKVVLLEDLNDNPGIILRDIFDFLGVDNNFVPESIGKRMHATDNKAGKSGVLMNMIRKIPNYHAISNLIPESTKRLLNKVIRQKADPPVKMDNETRAYLKSALHSDIKSLESYLDRDLSGWL